MQNFNYGKVAQHYQQADIYGSVESADRHALVSMLFNGLTSNLLKGISALEHNDVSVKVAAINKSLDILDALRSALDFDKGGELATHLDQLYEYMQRTLVSANKDSNNQALLEVSGLIDDIKQAWFAIPESDR